MTNSKKPEIGKLYDRKEISEMFGGSYRRALPFKNGDVVSGCFDPTLNPNAPVEILVGLGRDRVRYSQRIVEQNTPIPIFLKRASKKYEFVGYYRATKYSDNRKEVKDKNKSNRNHDDIAAVLYFEKAEAV